MTASRYDKPLAPAKRADGVELAFHRLVWAVEQVNRHKGH